MGKRLTWNLVMKAECEPRYFGYVSKKIIHSDALTELKKLPFESM